MATNKKRAADATSEDMAGESDDATNRGQKVNKTQEIRRVAKEMADKGKRPRPMEIVAILKEEGVPVTSSQVSTALTDTEWAFRPRRKSGGRATGERTSLAAAVSRQVSYDDLLAALEFVRKLGDIDKCVSALVALKELQAFQAAKGDSGGAGLADRRQADETAPWPSGQKWPAAAELSSPKKGEQASS